MLSKYFPLKIDPPVISPDLFLRSDCGVIRGLLSTRPCPGLQATGVNFDWETGFPFGIINPFLTELAEAMHNATPPLKLSYDGTTKASDP